MNRARNSWQKRMITESLKTPSFSSWIHFIGTRTPRRSDSTRSIQTSTTYSLKDQFPVLCPGELQHKHMFWSSLLKKSANEPATKIMPARRQRTLEFKLQPLKTIGDVAAASEASVSGVARGQLTPAEGQAVLRDAGGPAPRNRDVPTILNNWSTANRAGTKLVPYFSVRLGWSSSIRSSATVSQFKLTKALVAGLMLARVLVQTGGDRG